MWPALRMSLYFSAFAAVIVKRGWSSANGSV
jgi:hypothetical protein